MYKKLRTSGKHFSFLSRYEDQLSPLGYFKQECCLEQGSSKGKRVSIENDRSRPAAGIAPMFRTDEITVI